MPGYFEELWEDWLRPLSIDCIKTFSILAVLYGVWEALSFMRYRGYPQEYLDAIEKIHFAFLYTSLLILGASFVLKLAIGLWKK